MSLSYWEYKSWLSQVDFTIVGSGITGLSCALQLKKHFPASKVLILEKGCLPQGASTKNAGFACFGSISEILDDLQHHSEEEVFKLVQKRYQGINLLRNSLGDEALGYQGLGGHELFLEKDRETYEECREAQDRVNQLLYPVFNGNAFRTTSNRFGFEKITDHYITHEFEGQIDTGMMMMALLQKTREAGVLILNAITVKSFTEQQDQVAVETGQFQFKTGKLLIATNGFASQWFPEAIRPARAQVLVTKPIVGLQLEGTFHLDKGYYYFRNIDGRILIGGGRNLDFKGEETTEFGETELIQQRLESLLEETILPGIPFEVDRRWSGIMGVGDKKSPVVKAISSNVFCGVRLGGMGIAIGSLVGKDLADLVKE